MCGRRLLGPLAAALAAAGVLLCTGCDREEGGGRQAGTDGDRRRLDATRHPGPLHADERRQDRDTTPATRRAGAPFAVKVSRAQIEAARKAGVAPVMEINLGSGVAMKLVLIPAGSFIMGSPKTELERKARETQHRVTISRPFYVGVTEVTQAQYEAVVGENPSRFKGSDLPVEMVSWLDCTAFIERLNARVTVRDTDAGSALPVFRLPTEAEWEYACRAGTTTPLSTGATITVEQANYNGHYTYGTGPGGAWRKRSLPVASFQPNAWGLYDVHGNVWEWCSDWYGPYPRGPVTDPAGPPRGLRRLVRGGSWFDSPDDCRSANRIATTPANRDGNVGLRLARTAVSP